jgi:hypothetical protein
MRANNTILVFLLIAFAISMSNARADDPKPVPNEQCTAQNQQICNNQLILCRRPCLRGKLSCSANCCVKFVACIGGYSCSTQGYDCSY